jgi:type I restriction enzyme S subunit
LVADSAAAAPLALSLEERGLVRDIIDAVIPGAEVSVFGSRSTGRARRYSDLDLLFTRPARLTLAQRAELRSRFEASRLPFRVDLVDADALAPGMAMRVRSECRRL